MYVQLVIGAVIWAVGLVVVGIVLAASIKILRMKPPQSPDGPPPPDRRAVE